MKKLNKYEIWYMEQLHRIIETGQFRGDRTGTGVYSVGNIQYTHDLRESHPLMFGRFFDPSMPITEMVWMLSGVSNIQYLKDNGCPFWNGFATQGDMINTIELNRVERLKIYANNRGVPVTEAVAAMAMVPANEIDDLLDKHQVPNFIDEKVPNGELGPVYGVQWRNWPNPDGTTFDQIQYALDTLKNDPNSRRVVVDCWNPSFLPDPKISPRENAAKGKMALTPCHLLFGFYIEEIPFHERLLLLQKVVEPVDWRTVYPITSDEDFRNRCLKLFSKYDIPVKYIDINFVMRSNDWILGQPANMNMYSALLMMFGQQLNMVPRYVNYTGWDCHVYSNHLDGAKELMERWKTGKHKYSTVSMTLTPRLSLFDYHHSDFNFVVPGSYKPEDKIKFPIAI